MESLEILDHGYLKYIEHWGSDERIIEAARTSTNKGFLGWEAGPCSSCYGQGRRDKVTCLDCDGKGTHRGDKHLLKYLYDNKHATPFEMAGIVIEVQAPIMVFREWHRHRTQSYSEMSARYIPLPDLYYLPSAERLMEMGKDNKQSGRLKGSDPLTIEEAWCFRERLIEEYRSQQRLYELALKMGVPKELARLHLGVARYSRMRASANLRNWLDFLTLRMDQKAQYEIRQYANALGELIEGFFPRTWQLFDESIPE